MMKTIVAVLIITVMCIGLSTPSVSKAKHHAVYTKPADDSTLCILRIDTPRQNVISALGKLFEVAEIGRRFDNVYPDMKLLKQMIRRTEGIFPASVFELSDSADTSFHEPWSVGVWICPRSHSWIRIVATDADGDVIASADNFPEAKKKFQK